SLLVMSDFFQVAPEGLFEADTGLVSANHDGSFHNCGFHWGSPVHPWPRYPVNEASWRGDGTQVPRNSSIGLSKNCECRGTYICAQRSNQDRLCILASQKTVMVPESWVGVSPR